MKPKTARAGLAAGVLAWVLATALVLKTLTGSITAARGPGGNADAAIAALAALSALGVLLWLGVAATCSWATMALPARHPLSGLARAVGNRITPVVARRVLAATIGAALLSGASPAMAAVHPGRPAAITAVDLRAGTGVTLDPSWPAATPDGPGPSSRIDDPGLDPSWGRPGRLRPGVRPEQTVVVRRGDTLWDLAARHLGPAATDAEIAREWPLWFAANRAAIGSDPDRLRPGQQLTPPPTDGGAA
jgi:hypothetical protein